MGGDDGFQLPVGDEDAAQFENDGPTAQKLLIRQTLDAEAENFLDFVENAIAERSARYEDDPDGLAADIDAEMEEEYGQHAERHAVKQEKLDRVARGCIAFGELITPEQNTKIVAAQGLLHVLTLATKGVLGVRQEVEYGDIELSAVVRANARSVAGGGGEEDGEDEHGAAEERNARSDMDGECDVAMEE